MGSSRLPGKMMLDLKGKTVLERVVERVKDSKRIDRIVVATSINKKDDVIADKSKESKVDCFHGSENDVLERYYEAAKKYGYNNIVRVTGDCPMIDPEIIDQVIGLYFAENLEYATNVIPPTFPDGLDCEIFSFDALEKAWSSANNKTDREHVTTYMWGNPEIFRQKHINNEIDISKKRWTLDNEEDYELIKIVYENLFAEKPKFRLRDLIKFFNENPEIEKINSNIKRNEGLAKSLRENNNIKSI
jgi:spore coat polysaccharide biosynthesis protein SpsF